jgi:hypothetical protein
MSSGDHGYMLNDEILRACSKVYGWGTHNPEIRELASMDEEQLQSYSGSYILYHQDSELILEITREEGHLKGYQTWEKYLFLMLPEGEDRFFNPDDAAGFKFERDEEGAVIKLFVDLGYETYELFKKDNLPL